MKKILVPTDFTSGAEHAVKTAALLATQTGATVRFLHVAETLINWNGLGFLSHRPEVFPTTAGENLLPELKEALDQVRSRMDALVAQLSQKGLQAEYGISYGPVYSSITEDAERCDADLIVMGSFGASGFEEAFIGSNAQRVIRHGSRPVLVIRESPENLEVNHLVFPSDFQEERTEQNLERLKQWAEVFTAHIHLLFVNTPGHFQTTTESLERMDELAEKVGLQNFSVNVYNDYTVEHGILAFCRQMNVDLVAMAPHGYEGFQRIMHNNITEVIVNRSSLPVLALSR